MYVEIRQSEKCIFNSPVFNVQKIDTVLQTTDYQPPVYRRHKMPILWM